MIRSRGKRKLLEINGISEEFGYIVVDENFPRETFTLIREELEGLVARYKQWDTEHRGSQESREWRV